MQNQQLANLGFRVADTLMPKRVIVAINGHRGKGKTHIGLTSPGPLAVFNLDIGLSGVVQKFASAKTIHVMDLRVPATQEDANREWNRFYAAWTAALKSKDIRSIAVDTETELWELFRMARFGQLAQIMPYQYAPVNAEYARFLREILSTEKNLVLLRHLKPVYINDKRTKDYEAAGFGGVEKIVEVVGEVWRDELEDGGAFNLSISKCRLNPGLDGETLSGDMASFPWLATMCVEGTGIEDWS